jgi:hypothetical protein
VTSSRQTKVSLLADFEKAQAAIKCLGRVREGSRGLT